MSDCLTLELVHTPLYPTQEYTHRYRWFDSQCFLYYSRPASAKGLTDSQKGCLTG